jgi:hypothetical protein
MSKDILSKLDSNYLISAYSPKERSYKFISYEDLLKQIHNDIAKQFIISREYIKEK